MKPSRCQNLGLCASSKQVYAWQQEDCIHAYFGLYMFITNGNALQDSSEDRSYHTVITAQGSATHWQARVHYYWFKKVRMRCRSSIIACVQNVLCTLL